MKKTNIIFFTGENHIFLKKELDRWIKVFEEKHGEFNISRITNENIDKVNIESELTTPPFLSQNRLIILEDMPFSGNSKEQEDKVDLEQENPDKNQINVSFKIDEKILNTLDKIPDNNFVIFIQENPDKRKNLYKKLIELSTVKEFKNPDDNELRKYIRERLVGIDNEALNKLIEYKNSKFQEIELEIDKLSLFRNHERISKDDIEKYVTKEIESKIFSFIDSIFDLNYIKALVDLKNILESSKIEPTFVSIMTNIRKYIFTIYLKNSGLNESQIINIIPELPPFVYKNIISKSKNYLEILDFYNQLITLETNAKIGNIVGDKENGLKIALEKVILDLKKKKIHLQ